MKSLPTVAIVGRANVGKSSLFNRFVGTRQAIVADEAGTTRDSIHARVSYKGYNFRVVDTAGLKRAEDAFEASIQEQIIEAADAADVILVVVEATTQITEEDRTVAKLALKSKKPVILVANKADKLGGRNIQHWDRTGITTILPTSTIHTTGINDLFDEITTHIEKVSAPEQTDVIRISLIGRPNVGKSSLFNALGKKQQAIVADVAGTTRDVNTTEFRYFETDFQLLDTAGIRKKAKQERGAEQFSYLRTLQAIDESDVCVLVLDAHEHNVAFELKLAGMIAEAGKGMILAISKWDDIEKDTYTMPQITKEIARKFHSSWWAPLVFTSSVTGQNITKLLDLSKEIVLERAKKIRTTSLNTILQTAVSHHPPAGLKNTHPKLNYITQTDQTPPTFQVYGRKLQFLHWSYKRFLEKAIRAEHEFMGTPIRIFYTEDKPVKK